MARPPFIINPPPTTSSRSCEPREFPGNPIRKTSTANKCRLNDVNGYAVRHNPVMYFDDVTGTNCSTYAYGIAHIRPYSELAGDLTNGTVARYNFITPNLCDDGHDTCAPLNNNLAQTDTWLSAEIPKIMASSAYTDNGAIFITWDEGVNDDGPIGMIVLSPLARGGGYSNNIAYTHSSLLRSMQETFGVGPLLNDATNAASLSDLFAPLSLASATLRPEGFRFTLNGVDSADYELISGSFQRNGMCHELDTHQH